MNVYLINSLYPLKHVKSFIGLWKEEYKTIRPHSPWGFQPLAFMLVNAPTYN